MPSSPIIFCPGCAKKFKGKDDLRGKKIRCPFCKQPFVVPDDDDVEQTLPPRKSARPGADAARAAPPRKKPPPIPRDDDAERTLPPRPGGPPKAPVKMDFAPPSTDDDEDEKNPYGVTEMDMAPRCPNCANEMESEEAVVCLYCGYNTLTREWGKTEKVIATTGGEHFMYLLPGILCAVFILLQIVGMLYYCVVLPFDVGKTFWRFTDHESMRVWTTVAGMFDIWPVGYFAFNRLVLNPSPPAKVKK